MSAVVSEGPTKERQISELNALKRFSHAAVSLYREEGTWEYLADQGLPTSQMLFADFDTDSRWEQTMSLLPARFAKRAHDIHAAVVAARPYKRALVDESMHGVLEVDMVSDETPIRITPYQELELAAWEKTQLRGAHSAHILTDILLYTNPSFILDTQKNKKGIETAAYALLNPIRELANIPHTTHLIPAEKVIEGLLTSSVPLRPPTRRHLSRPASR